MCASSSRDIAKYVGKPQKKERGRKNLPKDQKFKGKCITQKLLSSKISLQTNVVCVTNTWCLRRITQSRYVYELAGMKYHSLTQVLLGAGYFSTFSVKLCVGPQLNLNQICHWEGSFWSYEHQEDTTYLYHNCPVFVEK